MKKSLLFVVFAFISCQDQGVVAPFNPQERDIINLPGVIQKISSTLYVIGPERGEVSGETFIPLNLPVSFKVDGILVSVTGRTKIIPLSIAYPGTPLEISSIVLRN